MPEPGRVERGLVEHIDVGPTLRALAEAGPVPGSDGQSLRGHFEGGGHGATRDLAVSENHGFAAFITDRYKLIVWEDTREPVALFDLERDPEEDRNILDDQDAGAIRRRMMERYVEPFLAAPPVRRGPHLVERQARWAE